MKTLLLDTVGTLYRLTFPNGKAYIGITTKPMRRRLSLHRHHVRKGRPGALQSAIRKFGEASFSAETLVVASDRTYLCDLERRAIAAFETKVPGGYNLTGGGEGTLGVTPTAEQRTRASEVRKGIGIGNQFALGYRHTDDAKQRIGAAGMGRVFSAESRAKISATKIGNKYGAGRTCSPETRAKIAAAQIGVPKPRSPK